MRLAVVTDEISADPEAALALAAEWGLGDVELRTVGSGRLPDIDDHSKRRLLRALREYGANVVALSPGLFKVPLDSKEDVKRHLKTRLPRSIELAKELGTRYIVVFTFLKPEDRQAPQGAKPEAPPIPGEIVDLLAEAAAIAAEEKLSLLIENEPVCYADTGLNTAGLLRRLPPGSYGINWDPANAFSSGEVPFPDGYAWVRESVVNVHAKDASAPHQYASLGAGVIDWCGQIEALNQDRYRGCISVETHFEPKVSSTKASLESLRALVSRCPREHAELQPLLQRTPTTAEVDLAGWKPGTKAAGGQPG